jgi:hypothetical protein
MLDMDLHRIVVRISSLVLLLLKRRRSRLTFQLAYSPFGKRCTGIHDSRVTTSISQSWLPHTETQGNTIATDINVDGLHQKRLHSILYDNPFGNQFTLTQETNKTTCSTWDDLFGLVCGDATDPARRSQTKDGWIAGSSIKRGRHVHPIYKLQIALKLRGTDSDWMYKYRPQHIVNEELCMVIQKRAFRVTSNDHTSLSGAKNQANRTCLSSSATSTSSVVEIPLADYNARLPSNILVHEIAFGPDSDPSVRGLALWFNISESDITICTSQQAKRFRWKKTTHNVHANNKTTRSNAEESSTFGNVAETEIDSTAATKPSVFESGAIDSFPMVRPHDDAAFRLVTEMMKHRLAFLKRERMSGMKERFDALQRLQRQEAWLKERFENQKRAWVEWAWPVNIGRSTVDDSTPVPPVDGPYVLEEGKPSHSGNRTPNTVADDKACESKEEMGRSVHRIWNAYISTLTESSNGKINVREREVDFILLLNIVTKFTCFFLDLLELKIKSSGEHLSKSAKRLSIFEALAQGQQIDQCRILPHIIKHCSTKSRRAIHPQQERCWRALLHSESFESNEWNIVREHFENSRSKKVLTILQQ